MLKSSSGRPLNRVRLDAGWNIVSKLIWIPGDWVIEELFPVHPPRLVRTYDVPVHAIPLFTEELIVAAKSLKKGRAPGPNGIPAEVLQVIALRCPVVLI